MMTYGLARAKFAYEGMIAPCVDLSPAATNMGSAEFLAETEGNPHPHSFTIQAETAIRYGKGIQPGPCMEGRSRHEDSLVPS